MFFFLTYFTLCNRFQFHLPHYNWFKCFLFNSWVIFHCVYVLQLSYPFVNIKKRWQEYTEELHKNNLHDPNNHDGVITHLEPDILEWEVKWALGSITTNKASGHDGIPVELFQILKDDAVKVLRSICQQMWKTAVAAGLEKVFSFQSLRKAIPKNAQTTAKLHSSHMLVK